MRGRSKRDGERVCDLKTGIFPVKALMIEGVERYAFRDIPDSVPGPGEVLVAVRHIGLCGSNLATFTGLNPLVVPYTACGTCTSCRQGRIKGRINACRSNRTLGVQRRTAGLPRGSFLPKASSSSTMCPRPGISRWLNRRRSVLAVGFGGRVVYIGCCKAPVSYDAKFFNLKELDIMGSRNAAAGDFKAVVASLENLDHAPDDLISKIFPFEDAALALP